MIKFLFLICCVVTFFSFHSQVVYAGQIEFSENLTVEDVQSAIMSVALGGIRQQSGIIDISNIDQSSIKVIEVHQVGNSAIVYCNFNRRQ